MPKDEQDIRRDRLSAYLRDECHGNKNELSRKIERSPTQTNDMLSGRKSFGEKIARDIELKIGKQKGWLDIPEGDIVILTSVEASFIHNFRQLSSAERELFAEELRRRAVFAMCISEAPANSHNAQREAQ